MSTSLGILDPTRVLWEAFGSPVTDGLADSPGDCARCGTTTDRRARVKTVVSDKFTGWDDYTGDRNAPGTATDSDGWDPRWCGACTWAHTDQDLRVRPWIVTVERCATTPATPADLRRTLMLPLPNQTAVLLPFSRQKHLLPHAAWGHIRTDDRTLPWGPREAARFSHLLRLRSLGFSETALAEEAPRFEVLRRHPAVVMRQIFALWTGLTVWREDPVYLRAACLASRTVKETPAVDEVGA